MEPAEYKHVVLGLVFLKYISDAFAERHAFLSRAVQDATSDYFVPTDDAYELVVESRDEYTSEGVFWVPLEARWPAIQASAKQPGIGKLVDSAMDAIEEDNPSLRGVLPKDFARPSLDQRRLGELIDLIGAVGFGDAANRNKDVLGRVYEYFLSKFATSEGKGGGEFYTPQSVVRLLVEMLEPLSGRVFDPCCGSGGMFVQSLRFLEAHGGHRDELSVFGQELTSTTWRLAKMNLAIRGIEANLGDEPADSFHDDKHPDLRANFVLANPPFNVSDWGGDQLLGDPRWQFGAPPTNNANFAWLQHIAAHLAHDGVAGVVLANGSMSSQQSNEAAIRRTMVEGDIIDCMVALPTQLFYSTAIPVCLWFLARGREDGRFRDRRGEMLFIDATRLGRMVSRVHRVLDERDIGLISGVYHSWRAQSPETPYADELGFCKSVPTDVVADQGFVLSPSRYVGAPPRVESAEPPEQELARLRDDLSAQIDEAERVNREVRELLAGIQPHVG